MDNTNFYNNVSDFYDEMINFSELVIKREKALSIITGDNKLTIADVGCGTGVDSIALKRLGNTVYSFDPSAGMIEKAKSNAAELKAKINFYVYGAGDIPAEFNNKFDLVISLGNTFANINENKFDAALENAFDILKSGGKLYLHILNFSKILNLKDRILNITSNGGYYFIRFYDFQSKELNFNVLRFNAQNPSNRELITTHLFPYTYKSFEKALTENHFININYYSSFTFAKFDETESKDLFIYAEKP